MVPLVGVVLCAGRLFRGCAVGLAAWLYDDVSRICGIVNMLKVSKEAYGTRKINRKAQSS